MKLEEIKALDNEIINNETLDEIWEHEEVESCNYLGYSYDNKSCYWYDVQFVDGDSINVYVEREIDEVEWSEEKTEELHTLGEVFHELEKVVEFNFVGDDKIEIVTTNGKYHACKIHGTWGFLQEADAF